MSGETPSWLEPGNVAPAPAASPASSGLDNSATSGGATAAAGTSNYGVTQDDQKDLPGIILSMRLANMGVAAFLITVSILTILSRPPVSALVLSVYAICGGLLICCLETQLKFLRVMIAVNFGFLFNSVWRFLYYMILASVAWSFDVLLGQIAAATLVGVAFFNTYILCRYPSYRKIREQIAEEEDKRIEARISKEVKRQAVSQLTTSK